MVTITFILPQTLQIVYIALKQKNLYQSLDSSKVTKFPKIQKLFKFIKKTD